MVTEDNKALALLAVSAFGGTLSVVEYRDVKEILAVDILTCVNTPMVGINQYSTIGLSDYPMYQDTREFPVRLEVVGVCKSTVEWFPNLLASTAFYVMREGWLCCPGAVLQNAIDEYAAGGAMRHLYFTAPFLWADKLASVQLTTKKVAWLLAVPISEAEYRYCKKYGDRRLEDLLETKEVNFFDIERESSV